MANYTVIYYQDFIVYFQNLHFNVYAIDKSLCILFLKTIGPFQVRSSGPVFDGVISFDEIQGDVLVASWDSMAYRNEDINEDYLKAVKYSLGKSLTKVYASNGPFPLFLCKILQSILLTLRQRSPFSTYFYRPNKAIAQLIVFLQQLLYLTMCD